MAGFLSKMAPREQLIVIVVIALGLLLAVVFLLLKPQVDEANLLRAEQLAVQAQIDEAENALDEAKSVKERAKDNRIRLSQLREAVPENDQIPALIVDLPQLAEDSGVSLTSFSPAGTDAAVGSQVPFQMSVQGTFFDTLDFLYRLQNFPRYLRVNRVAVEKAEPSGELPGENILRVNVDATSYFGAPPEAVTGDAVE